VGWEKNEKIEGLISESANNLYAELSKSSNTRCIDTKSQAKYDIRVEKLTV
jgi:hypothetical protein